eukprot:1161553-Pelagomonas_calceolata.AAC.2
MGLDVARRVPSQTGRGWPSSLGVCGDGRNERREGGTKYESVWGSREGQEREGQIGAGVKAWLPRDKRRGSANI